MTKQDLLNRLVENAIDFLLQSVEEIETKPKYSVIHFHAAAELFLKARLLAEHWSLVVSRRQVPDWDKFVSGDFVSVSLEEAASKLDKSVKSGLTEVELCTLKDVARHRNRTVHFFHEAHASTQGGNLVQDIARNQLTAWFYLYRLVMGKWRDVFDPWLEEIQRADRRLKGIHSFLQIVFDQRRREIEKRKSRGSTFETCPSCQFLAQEHKRDGPRIYEAKCLVCDLSEWCVAIECPVCNEEVMLFGEGFAGCLHCEETLEPQQVADTLISSGAEGMLMPANCRECDGYGTVVATKLKIDTDVYGFFAVAALSSSPLFNRVSGVAS